MGAGLGLPVAVPGWCSDCASSLSPCATRDDSALPPSVRSPSGTWGRAGAEGPVLGWGGLPAPTSPKSCFSVTVGQSFAETLRHSLSSSAATVAAARAVPWGLSRHDPSHTARVTHSLRCSCPFLSTVPAMNVPQAAPFCGSSALDSQPVLGDTTQAALLGRSSCPSVTKQPSPRARSQILPMQSCCSQCWQRLGCAGAAAICGRGRFAPVSQGAAALGSRTWYQPWGFPRDQGGEAKRFLGSSPCSGFSGQRSGDTPCSGGSSTVALCACAWWLCVRVLCCSDC